MKAILKGAAIVAVSFAGVQAANAATGTGNASVDIVENLTISETAALNFGNVVPDGASAQTVTVTTAGAGSSTIGANFLGGAAAGAFTVNGTPSQLIVFSNFTDTGSAGAGNVTLSNGTAADDMVAALTPSVTADGSTTYTLDGTTGDYSFTVGGALAVAAGQTEGAYSGQYNFDVNYQ